MVFLPGIPGGSFTVGEDLDGDGYDDDTGEYVGGGDEGGGDPYDPDYDGDGDGISDEDEWAGVEVIVAYEMTYYDETTGEEYIHTEYVPEVVYTDPADSDSDDDLLPDGWEVLIGFNPMDPTDGNSDAGDGDGLSYGREYVEGTNPDNPNTDGDAYDDFEEVMLLSSDPNDPADPVEQATDDGTGPVDPDPVDPVEPVDPDPVDPDPVDPDPVDPDPVDPDPVDPDPVDPAETPDPQAAPVISLKGRSSTIGGGMTWTNEERVEVQDASSRQGFDDLIADGWTEEYFQETYSNAGYDDDGQAIDEFYSYNWAVTKGGEGDPNEPPLVSDYVARSYTVGHQPTTNILITADEVWAGSTFSGGILGFNAALNLPGLSENTRIDPGNGMGSGGSAQTRGDDDFPSGSWSQVWLHSDKPVLEEVRKTYVVISESDNSGDQAGTITFVIPKDEQVSQQVESSGSMRYTANAGGVVTLKPLLPGIEGQRNKMLR